MSSAGVLFEPDTALATGSTVELSIDWPVLHDGKQHMELVLCGTIVRLENARVALRVTHHAFTPYRPSEAFEDTTSVAPLGTNASKPCVRPRETRRMAKAKSSSVEPIVQDPNE